jgi:hypothetical protein
MMDLSNYRCDNGSFYSVVIVGLPRCLLGCVEARQRCGGSGEKGEESENERWGEFVGVLREKEEIEIGRERNNGE